MSSEKQQSPVNVKQRLIGAVVLIALAVIIIPSVLDLRKDYDHVIGISNIPPKPDDFKVEIFDFSKDVEIKVEVKAVEQWVDPKAVSKTKARVITEDPALVQARVSELRQRVNVSKGGKSAGQPTPVSWVVQLASLTRKENARGLQARVQKMGHHAFIVSSQVEGKTMYRVLVGPQLLKSNAEKERKLLQKEVNLSGLVIKYRR